MPRAFGFQGPFCACRFKLIRVVLPILTVGFLACMLSICILVTPGHSNDWFWDQDISSYGKHPEAGYVPFLLCFILVPFLLVLIAVVRHQQLLLALSTSRVCSPVALVDPQAEMGCQGYIVLACVVISGLFLAVMGASNGISDRVHSVCAVLGLCFLVVYEIAHTIVWWRLAPKLYPDLRCLAISRLVLAVVYLAGPVLTLLSSYKRIVEGNPFYEWCALGFVLTHYLPLAFELRVQFDHPGGFERIMNNDDACNEEISLAPTYIEMKGDE